MNKFKNSKGITLIALVITIIILLILAGVTINIVINGGLIEKSQTAVDTYSKEQAKERLQLALVEYKMKRLTGENVELNDFLETIEGITVDEENNKVNVNGYDFTVDEETLEIEGGNKGETPVTPEQKIKYTVTINKGTGIESVTETQQVEEGQNIEITATAQEGYEFNKWNVIEGKESDVENLTAATTKVTPTEDIKIEATAKTPQIANGNNLTGTEHGTITGENYAYNNPVIPVGFKTSNEGASWNSTNGTTVDGWNNGLVIQDGSGNQFVWVPVDNTKVTYAYHYDVISEGSRNLEQSLPEVILDKNNDKDKENDQIITYGGFYIARYEAGIPTDNSNLTAGLTTATFAARNKPGIPVSKKNQIPWNYISWSQAKTNAESMYTSNNVQSVLITDRMWETTCQWLEESGLVVKNTGNGSKDWGNYQNAPVTGITEYSEDNGAIWIPKTDSNQKGTSTYWLLKTGHTEYTNRNNIYDLAGNLVEWTNSKYSSIFSYYVTRGGYYYSNGADYPAAGRSYNADDAGNGDISFRVGLFVQ